jgi:hypothetical protein
VYEKKECYSLINQIIYKFPFFWPSIEAMIRIKAVKLFALLSSYSVD